MRASTDQVAPREREAFWRESVCRGFLPVETTAMRQSPVWGRFCQDQAGPLRLSLFESSAQRYTVMPSRRHETIMFDIVLSGTLEIEQGGTRTRVTPGRIGISDLRAPLVQSFALEEPRCSSLVVEVEADMVPSAHGHPVAAALSAQGGVGRLIERQARTLFAERDALPPAARSAAGHGLLALLLLVLNGMRDVEDDGEDDVVRRAAALLSSIPLDAPLDIDGVARALRVSRRTLFRRFAMEGTTPSTVFLAMRLEKARAAMATTGTRSSITQIALDHGFADHAHFSRAFLARYGRPPSADRAACADARRGGRSG